MVKNSLNQWTFALLRVVLGVVFAFHGYLKLFVPGGFKQIAGLVASIGFPAPAFFGLVVSVVEFAGGLFLLLGVVTRLSTILLLIDMLVALFTVHIKNGLLVYNGGYEFVLVLLAGLVVILANGSGKLSLGKLFKYKYLQ